MNEADRSLRKWIAKLFYKAGRSLVLNGNSRYHTRQDALEFMDLAGSLGYAKAWTALGCYYGEGGIVRRDFGKYIMYSEAAGEMGEPDALGNLAEIFWVGIGTERNPTKSVSYAMKAIETREKVSALDACYLGLAYLLGEGGVDVDHKKAFTLFKKAATSRDQTNNGRYPDKRVLAYYQLGRMYMDGLGVTRNKDEAKRWFKKCLQSKDDPNQPGWRESVEAAAEALNSLGL